MTKDIKLKIDKLVDLYLDHLASPDQDAGWRNCSQWEAMLNEIKSTSGDKDMRMIQNTELLRKPHFKLPLAISALYRGIKEPKHRIAILAHRHYEGRLSPDGKIMSEARVAAFISCTTGQYQHNKKMAYQKMEIAVDMLSEYDDYKHQVSEAA